MSLELHRQCVFPALAVVGGVDGINVPPPTRELGGVIPADAVELHGVDAAQRTDKPLRAVLPVVQLHKVHHAPQDSRPEGIRSALPRRHDVPQGFAVDLFAQLVVQLQRRAHAADAVVKSKKYCDYYTCGKLGNWKRQRQKRLAQRTGLVCRCCGKTFTPKRKDAVYCSNACRQKSYRQSVTDKSCDQKRHMVEP